MLLLACTVFVISRTYILELFAMQKVNERLKAHLIVDQGTSSHEGIDAEQERDIGLVCALLYELVNARCQKASKAHDIGCLCLLDETLQIGVQDVLNRESPTENVELEG